MSSACTGLQPPEEGNCARACGSNAGVGVVSTRVSEQAHNFDVSRQREPCALAAGQLTRTEQPLGSPLGWHTSTWYRSTARQLRVDRPQANPTE